MEKILEALKKHGWSVADHGRLTAKDASMNLQTRLLTLSALASFLAAPARADVRPVSAKEDVARLPAPSARLYAETTLFPQSTKWRDAIPWVLDLSAGIRLASEEKRPLLIWVSGDDPLERC
jgi:hypothetical protein